MSDHRRGLALKSDAGRSMYASWIVSLRRGKHLFSFRLSTFISFILIGFCFLCPFSFIISITFFFFISSFPSLLFPSPRFSSLFSTLSSLPSYLPTPLSHLFRPSFFSSLSPLPPFSSLYHLIPFLPLSFPLSSRVLSSLAGDDQMLIGK